MVHLSLVVPVEIPVTVVLKAFESVITAVFPALETNVQIPVPVPGLFPAKTVLEVLQMV
ncbi:hypothetical protein D9M71_686260 [compost metagenome]